uniref:L-type lectin-like domain-containing protein n=1 Tax=Chromera velia CCMP2878 TaxID=1169474 RepID=A0A0G4IFK3_9ALVE|mmetsp:Transcript_13275/g.26215  ORF Transcript_13275/g.26215 Transcript_13275/m.26215 type:complete len:466 (+) Transcript_13275:166-1563(+)|eukprot:Cvel_14070.t1-p1 / transcript=Cvel_14070.t1 / gene=Cvel_14070 / organism=Chromera_velia_CCMP2878 / gene_product=Protein ERGIC-53, putative / transcript_product=Protein ERGIC-53, putative / location=Cvel_scaffold987:51125-55708(+) / protein_length=465 / sequence_SO=supercontig / SO=protein_coding / is_pseudo=false
MMRPFRSLFNVASVACALLIVAVSGQAGEQLARHSFASPFGYDTMANWNMAGASILNKQHLVLMPGVPDRFGEIWHKDPIRTGKFMVEFDFLVKGPGNSLAPGFAFWYVYEDFNKVRPSDNNYNDWTLFGYKPTFKGLGTFFSNYDHQGKFRPFIGPAYHHGRTDFRFPTDIDEREVSKVDFRNGETPLSARITVTDQGVKCDLRLSPGARWFNAFFDHEIQLEAGGYIGFSAHSGPEGSLAEQSDKVMIFNLQVTNLDPNVKGEEDIQHEVHAPSQPHPDVLHEHAKQHSGDLEAKDGQEAVQGLTRLLYKHISESQPRERVIQKTISTLENQIDKLTKDIEALGTEVRSATGASHEDAVRAMKHELSGMRTMLARDAQKAQHTLTELHKVVEAQSPAEGLGVDGGSADEEVERLQQQTQALSEAVAGGSAFFTWVFLAVVVIVIAAAVLIYRKQRAMEKKHVF